MGLPVGDESTCTDLLVHHAWRLPAPVIDLVVGVSVGKGFFQPHLVGVAMNLDRGTTRNASIAALEDDSSVA